jgi:hypothetical protein
MNETDEREADQWTRRAPMTRQEKAALAREMAARLRSGLKENESR